MLVAVVAGALGALLVVAVVWAVAAAVVVRRAEDAFSLSLLLERLERADAGAVVWAIAAGIAPGLVVARLVARLDAMKRARPILAEWGHEIRARALAPLVELPAGASS